MQDMIEEIFIEKAKDFAATCVKEITDKITSELAVVSDTAGTALLDTVHEMAAGKQSLDDWAELSAKGADEIAQKIADTARCRYCGGKLRFSISADKPRKVSISFDLFFLDDNNQWHKASSGSDANASMFTEEALNELRERGVIEYTLEA